MAAYLVPLAFYKYADGGSCLFRGDSAFKSGGKENDLVSQGH